MEGELLDWELVHGSDTESTDSITSMKKSGSGSSVIDDGMILSDHFSTEKLVTLPDQSLDSSRVVNGSESLNRVELGFDQSGDGSVRSELGFYDSKIGTFVDSEVKVSDFEAADEKKLLLVDTEVVSESTGGTVSHCEDGHLLGSDHLEFGDGRGHVEKVVESEAVSESTDGTLTHGDDERLLESDDLEVVGDGRRQVESQSVVEEPIEDLSMSWSDSGGNELVSGDDVVGDSVVSTEANEESGGSTVDSVVRSGGESKSRETVWWKMPFVIVKYYAFRIGPVWSVSMAAALMGFVLLGRRLYNMKKKAQRFHLKVAIDEKKVSRVMSQAARLNEAFTEVRRVPVIRPALPSPGAWPVLSLR